MGYDTLSNLATGDLVTEAMWDIITDNFDYLLAPNGEQILHSEGGSYSITNQTTFADIDATDLTIDVVTFGGRILVAFACRYIFSSGNAYFDIAVDGTRVGSSFTAGLAQTTGVSQFITIPVLIEGLAAGTYTITPQWRTSTTNTAEITSSTTSPVIFSAVEIH